MFLRVRLPSPLTPIIYFSPLYSLSSSSKICSDRTPSGADRSSVFFSFSKSTVPFSLSFSRRRRGHGFLRSRCTLRSCRASTGNESHGPDVSGDEDSDQYIQALLLAPETVRHYNLWKQGFIEETKWHSAAQKYPFSSHRKVGADLNVHSIGHGFLRRFQSPTVFLKIACDGDLLLPIIVGEFAIIRLIDALAGEEIKECPDQFQFVKNIVGKLGYEVKMVRITDRVVNTYYARIYLRKHAASHCNSASRSERPRKYTGFTCYAADNTNISIDARPSDALNVAERFKAPIYVNKEIVVKDAIKVVYGNWRARSSRMVYDVSLDSAPEEPDPLIEELDLVMKMNKAVLEERFEDAALWRDKLTKLIMPRQEL